MIKEIGSEFWNIPTSTGNNNYNNYIWFESGRSALSYILDNINIKSISLPSYCCDSMIKPFIDRNIDITFYPVSIIDNGLLQQYDYSKEAILVLDYFGFTTEEISTDYKGLVIRDITHSYFSYDYNDADYYFGSFRKWFGVITGGFAFSNKHSLPKLDLNVNYEYISIRSLAMYNKKLYIEGTTNNKDYLQDFAKYETYLDESKKIYGALKDDINSLKKLDIQFIKCRRRENAKIIMKHFSSLCLFKELSTKDCPLFVPILLTNNRDKIRSYLIKNNIYCPIHWPISDYHRLVNTTKEIYDQELSLICDHRYSIDDIEYMCSILKEAISLYYNK